MGSTSVDVRHHRSFFFLGCGFFFLSFCGFGPRCLLVLQQVADGVPILRGHRGLDVAAVRGAASLARHLRPGRRRRGPCRGRGPCRPCPCRPCRGLARGRRVLGRGRRDHRWRWSAGALSAMVALGAALLLCADGFLVPRERCAARTLLSRSLPIRKSLVHAICSPTLLSSSFLLGARVFPGAASCEPPSPRAGNAVRSPISRAAWFASLAGSKTVQHKD